jgi:glyoxylase-like metal-dependent hydrolase (beta-lactamase superfamily II)
MMRLGQELSVQVLRDGAFTIPASVLRASGVPEGVSGETPIFAFAINFGSEVWLVDAGAGPCLGSEGGNLLSALRQHGIDPASVTRVLLTHLHPDHVGGLADDKGRPHFRRAEVVLSLREWADWLSPSVREQHDEDATQVAAWAERALSGYSVLHADNESELGRGVRMLPAPGHRPGHLAFRLDAAAGGVLFGGDLLHLPDWQLADPDQGLVWDVDAEAARASRHHLLDLAAHDNLMVAGAHLGPWGLVKLEREGRGFRVTPAS